MDSHVEPMSKQSQLSLSPSGIRDGWLVGGGTERTYITEQKCHDAGEDKVATTGVLHIDILAE